MNNSGLLRSTELIFESCLPTICGGGNIQGNDIWPRRRSGHTCVSNCSDSGQFSGHEGKVTAQLNCFLIPKTGQSCPNSLSLFWSSQTRVTSWKLTIYKSLSFYFICCFIYSLGLLFMEVARPRESKSLGIKGSTSQMGMTIWRCSRPHQPQTKF